jgi:sporulation protein YlmC with PRC-barrel domain
MTTTEQFTIGADASCTDGPCGQVRSVVVDPLAKVVTHLVIEAEHRQGLGRLVPLDLVELNEAGVSLNCDVASFEKLELAEENQFLPGSVGYATYGPGQSYSWPFFALGMGIGGAGNLAQAVTYDTLPLGEVAIHRDERVHASDGEIGRVQGLVIEPVQHHVTHVLLQEGHLWGKKDVAIPISAVTRMEGGIAVNLTKAQVQDLPEIDINLQAI